MDWFDYAGTGNGWVDERADLEEAKVYHVHMYLTDMYLRVVG